MSARRPTNDEFWTRLYAVVNEGRRVNINEVPEEEIGVFAGQATCLCQVQSDAAPVSQRDMPRVPLAWEKSARASGCDCHPS